MLPAHQQHNNNADYTCEISIDGNRELAIFCRDPRQSLKQQFSFSVSEYNPHLEQGA